MTKRVTYWQPYRVSYDSARFRLTLTHGGEWDSAGRWQYAYKFEIKPHRESAYRVLFEGKDMWGHDAPESDRAQAAAMGWLTLRPGDTDDEYFESYTPEQLVYAIAYAESLSCLASDRFGDL